MGRWQRRTAIAVGLVLIMGCGSGTDGNESIEQHEEGDIPKFVILDSLQLAAAEFEYLEVSPAAPDTLVLTGRVAFDAARVSHVGPQLPGRIRRVAVETGSSVSVGDTLAVLDSPVLGAAQAAWFKASVKRDVAFKNYERVARLAADGIVSERRRLETEADLREAEAELAATKRGLLSLGASPDSTVPSLFVLTSPLRGTIVDKHATVGEVPNVDAVLFTVADLTRVWLMLDLYESDLPQVHEKMPVLITASAYPDRVFEGRVQYVGAFVDSLTRTIKVRVAIPNPDLVLKPGMFANAALIASNDDLQVALPRNVVQQLDGQDVVFLPDGGGRFRIEPVVLGEGRRGEWVEVLAGVAIGDTVVARGSFTLKAEIQKGSFGHGH